MGVCFVLFNVTAQSMIEMMCLQKMNFNSSMNLFVCSLFEIVVFPIFVTIEKAVMINTVSLYQTLLFCTCLEYTPSKLLRSNFKLENDHFIFDDTVSLSSTEKQFHFIFTVVVVYYFPLRCSYLELLFGPN